MLRKILVFTLVVYTTAVFTSADAQAWAAVVGIALVQLPSRVVTGIPIPAVGVAPAVVMAAGVATTMAVGVVIIMAATTVAAEDITPQGSVRAVYLAGYAAGVYNSRY